MSTRRKFIQKLGAAAVAVPSSSFLALGEEEMEKRIIPYTKNYASYDDLQVGIIGFGIMGSRNAKTIADIPGVRLKAVCDLYTGRLERARELYGKELFTTQVYQEVLDRSDMDAVIICTSDQWHDRISIEAMQKGKAVYCEKPLVHQLHQGWEVIKTQQQTGALIQVGSQRVSSIVYAEAKRLYQAGEIGQLNCIEASFDRHTSLGAWQYTIPPDASDKTVAWDRFYRSRRKPLFDARQFFRWRNYREFGTGVAGDLFVHLLSGIHFLTGSKGPSAIYATGDLSYWKDGRNVPDVMTAVMEYQSSKEHPAFQVLLKANLASGAEKVEGSSVKFYGTEGMIEFGWNEFTLVRNKFEPHPGIGGWDALDTYPSTMQQEILKTYKHRFPSAQNVQPSTPPLKFRAPEGYDDRFDHFINFFDSLRNGKPVVEDVHFGFRAAAPCLACNESYFQKKMIRWDPEKMVQM